MLLPLRIPLIIIDHTIVGLQDGVLGAHVQGPLLVEGIVKATPGKVGDGVISVVHSECYSWTLEVINNTAAKWNKY